jgi:hypothetical protein
VRKGLTVYMANSMVDITYLYQCFGETDWEREKEQGETWRDRKDRGMSVLELGLVLHDHACILDLQCVPSLLLWKNWPDR